MSFKVVIPARYASSRLPGKPLLDIGGRSMVQRVWGQALASGAEEVVIATDDARIEEAAKGFGAEVCMTRADHESGSDRLAEVVDRFGWADETIVVNVQGDEPFLPPTLIHQVAEDMELHPDAGVTTLCAPITERSELFDPHAVKVVLDAEGYALYFSRAPMPWHRDEFVHPERPLHPEVGFLRHIGLYAYRAGYLRQFVAWPRAPLEVVESLEQLRVLWHGGRIHVGLACEPPGHGVDTIDDLNRARERAARS